MCVCAPVDALHVFRYPVVRRLQLGLLGIPFFWSNIVSYRKFALDIDMRLDIEAPQLPATST